MPLVSFYKEDTIMQFCNLLQSIANEDIMMNKGTWYALGAYGLWGIFPLYWKALQTVPAEQILAHRITWSLLFLAIILTIRGDWAWLRQSLQDKRLILRFTLASVLLGLNWFVYIWGVNAGFVVETSLGYFINPLVNVCLGMIIFKERLRAGQWVAIGFAVVGVAYLTFNYGRLPWIALTLAFSFAFYGALKKTAVLNSQRGLTLETAILVVPAMGYLIFVEANGTGAFGHTSWDQTALMIGAGIATTIPLLLFAEGAQRITLTQLGILQYTAPTIQFLLGIFLYKEPFTMKDGIGFSLIWLALILYFADNLLTRRKNLKTAVSLD